MRRLSIVVLAVSLLAPPFLEAQPTSDRTPSIPETLVPLLRRPDGTPKTDWPLPLVGAFQESWGFRLVFTMDPRQPQGKNLVEVRLRRIEGSGPVSMGTPSFELQFLGPLVGGKPAPEAQGILEEVRQVVQANDPGPGFWAALGAGEKAPEGPRQANWLDRVMVAVGWVLVLGFLLGLPWILVGLWREVRIASHGWVLTALGLGLALRWWLPHRPVMYYMGYWLTQASWALKDIPKHGPAGLVLDHLLLQVFGPSHLVLCHGNAILGSGIPLAGAALLALCGVGVVGVRAALVLLAVVPVFVRDATTESLLVPTMLWALAGLSLWQRYRRDRRAPDGILALVGLLLAACSRPEFLLLIPLMMLALPPPAEGAWQGGGTAGRRGRWRLVWLLSAAVVLGLRVWHLGEAVLAERALGNLPVLGDPASLLALAPDFLRRNLALRPSWFPAGISALALLGPLLPGHRRLALGLLSAAAVGVSISLVDLPHVSLPRVQAPALTLLTLAAATALASVWGPLPRPRWRRGLGLATVVLVMATIPGATAVLWERTNADDEEDLWREVIRSLPPEPVVLVRRGPEDQPVERLHLFHPDYWFQPPNRDDLVLNLDRFPVLDPGQRPVFFVLSTRCWLRACGETGLHPACARVMEAYDLEPVFEREVPVRRVDLDRKVRPDQDLDFPWCVGVSERMPLGLYRVGSRRSNMTSASSPSW